MEATRDTSSSLRIKSSWFSRWAMSEAAMRHDTAAGQHALFKEALRGALRVTGHDVTAMGGNHPRGGGQSCSVKRMVRTAAGSRR